MHLPPRLWDNFSKRVHRPFSRSAESLEPGRPCRIDIFPESSRRSPRKQLSQLTAPTAVRAVSIICRFVVVGRSLISLSLQSVEGNMLVQIDSPSSERTSAVPSIMDSPTLARVERAMQRQDDSGSFRNHDTVSLNRSVLTQVSYKTSFFLKKNFKCMSFSIYLDIR